MWLAAGSGSEALGVKKFVFVVLMLLVGAGWAGFHAPELLPQAQRLADDALSHFERDDGAIHVEGSGAALPDVKKAASAFDGLTQEKLGAVRHHSVRVFVAASDADYRRILKEEFSLSDEEAQEVAAISGGWSGGRLHVTAVNAKAGVMDSHSDRYATTAHELFHQLQYELSRGRDTDKEALFWLEEGSADYVGAMMAEHLGGRKLARWQNDVLDDLLGAPHAARPDQLIHLEFAERKAIMAKEYHAYEMADMMTVQLLARFPEEQRGQRLAAYFTALGEGKSGEEAFAQTFGLTLDDFLQEFAAWWQAQKSEPAKIQIEACEGVTDGQVDSYAAEAEAVQSLLQRRFGQTLRGSYTLVLASGKEELAQAVSARSDMTSDEARKNVGESLWLENGSTVFLDAAALDSRRQQIFSMGVMLTRVMEAQAMGGTEQEVAWLARGTAYLIGTLRLSEEGLGSFEDYRRSWLSVLQEKGRFPDGADLTSPESYDRAVASFGDESCSLVAELTAHDLLARRGWGSFAKWMRATSLAGGDGEKAFRSTYGEGASAYASAASARLLREVQDMYTR